MSNVTVKNESNYLTFPAVANKFTSIFYNLSLKCRSADLERDLLLVLLNLTLNRTSNSTQYRDPVRELGLDPFLAHYYRDHLLLPLFEVEDPPLMELHFALLALVFQQHISEKPELLQVYAPFVLRCLESNPASASWFGPRVFALLCQVVYLFHSKCFQLEQLDLISSQEYMSHLVVWVRTASQQLLQDPPMTGSMRMLLGILQVYAYGSERYVTELVESRVAQVR